MKKIMWENWNEKEIELSEGASLESLMLDNSDNSEDQMMQLENLLPPFMAEMQSPNLHTPFGVVPTESALKPSDRWQCWMGYTNFDLTHKVSDRMKVINGVEALRIMSRYTFCVGVGKMFNFTSVRKEIENAICKQ
jgi:hypothetical protein